MPFEWDSGATSVLSVGFELLFPLRDDPARADLPLRRHEHEAFGRAALRRRVLDYLLDEDGRADDDFVDLSLVVAATALRVGRERLSLRVCEEEAEVAFAREAREPTVFDELVGASVEEKDGVGRAAVSAIAAVADGEVFNAVEVEVVEDEAVLLRVEAARLRAGLGAKRRRVFVKLDVRQPQSLEGRLRALSEDAHDGGAAAPVRIIVLRGSAARLHAHFEVVLR